MKKAASILQKSDLKIYEIAYIVGYNNISAFIKKFKQVFNVTPAEYRISNKS
jgi:AraC-like DNA-binding protein